MRRRMDCEGGTFYSNVTIKHIKTASTRVVHVNRFQQRLVQGEVEALGEPQSGVPLADCEAHTFVLPPQKAEVGKRYPQRVRHQALRNGGTNECNVTQLESQNLYDIIHYALLAGQVLPHSRC